MAASKMSCNCGRCSSTSTAAGHRRLLQGCLAAVATVLRRRLPSAKWWESLTCCWNSRIPEKEEVRIFFFFSPPNLRGRLADPKRLKLWTSNCTCMFPGTIQSRPLKIFMKRGVARVTWPPKFWASWPHTLSALDDNKLVVVSSWSNVILLNKRQQANHNFTLPQF